MGKILPDKSGRIIFGNFEFFEVHIFLTYVKIRQTPHFVCTQSPRLQSLENCRPPQSCAQYLIVWTFFKQKIKRIKERRDY